MVRAPAIEAQLDRDVHAADHQPPEPDRHQGQPHRAGPPTAARCWSLAPAGHRARTRLSSARARPISAAAPVRPAPSPTSSTAFPRAARWPTPGCRCSTREYEAFKTYCETVPHERHAAGRYLQHAANPACPTPSAPSTRCCKPHGHHASAASGWTRGDMAYLTPEGPQDARRGRLAGVSRSPCPTRWTSA